ncbi:MAG: hypothetical protein A6F71_10245 [Cycloclasticus sp. symbiont of Poecilosclerida sp. M]|nr:MAG: hypothetical protein A6F71_10245 [Cycloclasticus sp. symbiont of Poecilosclerida sp. M]
MISNLTSSDVQVTLVKRDKVLPQTVINFLKIIIIEDFVEKWSKYEYGGWKVFNHNVQLQVNAGLFLWHLSHLCTKFRISTFRRNDFIFSPRFYLFLSGFLHAK